MEFIKVHDTDVILLSDADHMGSSHGHEGETLRPLSQHSARSGLFKQMASKSYLRYGKVNHKDGALIPEGRILMDTAKSFLYTEGG